MLFSTKSLQTRHRIQPRMHFLFCKSSYFKVLKNLEKKSFLSQLSAFLRNCNEPPFLPKQLKLVGAQNYFFLH